MRTSPPPTPPPPVQPSVVNHKNWLNDDSKIRSLAYVQTIITLIVLIPNAFIYHIFHYWAHRGYQPVSNFLLKPIRHFGLHEYDWFGLGGTINIILEYWPAITLGVAACYSVRSIRQAQNRRKNLFISVAICASTSVLEILILFIVSVF